jgi:chromosome segregation and condensation protein ScpB
MGFVTTTKFLQHFGIESAAELPELPKYKLDENEQVVLDEVKQ